MPDSLLVTAFSPNGDGSEVAFVAITPSGTKLLGTVPVRGGQVTFVATLDDSEPGGALTWTPTGALYLSRWLQADDRPSLWVSSPTGAELRRVTDLPVPCDPARLNVSASGDRAVCKAGDYRSDIWVMDGLLSGGGR